MKISISSTEHEINDLFEQFSQELEDNQVNMEDRDLMLLCFVEAVNNAAEHGNQWSKEKLVIVETWSSNHFCLVKVKDQGQPFTPYLPTLTEVSGSRGRGLGMIAEFSDQMFFNIFQKEIFFWKLFKEQKAMKQIFDNAEMDILEIGTQGILATNIQLYQSGKMDFALTELLHEKLENNKSFILLDCQGIRILSSLSWGVIATFLAENPNLQFVLFNATPAIAKTARVLGFGLEDGPYSNLRVLSRLSNEAVV